MGTPQERDELTELRARLLAILTRIDELEAADAGCPQPEALSEPAHRKGHLALYRGMGGKVGAALAPVMHHRPKHPAAVASSVVTATTVALLIAVPATTRHHSATPGPYAVASPQYAAPLPYGAPTSPAPATGTPPAQPPAPGIVIAAAPLPPVLAPPPTPTGIPSPPAGPSPTPTPSGPTPTGTPTINPTPTTSCLIELQVDPILYICANL